MKQILFTIFGALLVLCLATSTLYAAAPIRVDCGKGDTISATLAHLAQTGNTRGVTIFVKGTCTENITIGGFDHLVLQGSPIATLQDASNGTAAVVLIYNSYDVTLQSFTINGGLGGVNCVSDSFCTVSLSTIQQSAAAGARFARSHGVLQNNKILNNAAQGVLLQNNSNLFTDSNQITNNGGTGIDVFADSYMLASLDAIQSNARGIRARENSVLRTDTVTISDNRSDGVRLESGAAASFLGDDTITGNAGNGVAVHDLSFASFGGDNVSGNLTQPDVACYQQFSATRGAGTVGGTTNCNEPSSPAGKK